MDDGTVNDFSRGEFSPQAHANVNGGNTAMCIIALLASVGALCMYIASRDTKTDLERQIEVRANATERRMADRVQLAERESRLALDKIEDNARRCIK